MITDWFRLKRQQASPTLKAIYIAASAGEPMLSVASVMAMEGLGLQGDRYCTDTGHWQSIEGCQVTLITEIELHAARKKTSALIETGLRNGAHRRNLVIDGLKTKQLEGRLFQIGSTVFRYDKPRPPCGYIDQVAGRGMGKALGHYSGICIKVVSSGRLSVGDTLSILE